MSLFPRSREDEPQDETMITQQSAHLYEDKRYRREYANKLSSGILTFAGTVFAVALTCIGVIARSADSQSTLNIGLLQHFCGFIFLFPAFYAIMTYKFYLENSVRIDTISAYQFETAKENVTWEKAKKNANLNYYYDENNNLNDGYKTFRNVYLLSLFCSLICYANTISCYPAFEKGSVENKIYVIVTTVLILLVLILKYMSVTFYRITRVFIIEKYCKRWIRQGFLVFCALGFFFFIAEISLPRNNELPHGLYAFAMYVILLATALFSPRFRLEATRANLIAKHIEYKFSIVINKDENSQEGEEYQEGTTYYEWYILSLIKEKVIKGNLTKPRIERMNLFILPHPEYYHADRNKFVTLYQDRKGLEKKQYYESAYSQYIRNRNLD